MNIRVLLIEDDRNLASGIVKYLELHKIDCDSCYDGIQGINLLNENTYNVIVSDINMPRMTGYDFCRQARSLGIDLPIMMLTSRDDINDKVEGFECGADDYLVKPFDQKELLLRINALSQRKSYQSQYLNISELGINIDLHKREARRDDVLLELSRSGWTLLLSLARAWPNPVPKRDLEYALWGDIPPESNGLKVHIHNLRKRIDKPFPYPIVKVVQGFGFVLAARNV